MRALDPTIGSLRGFRRRCFIPGWKLAALVILALIAAHSTPAFATSGTWSSTAATGAWQTAANWIGGSLPGFTSGTNNGDTAIFSLASSTTTITPDANRNLESITFDSSANSYTIGTTGGNALLLTAGGTIQNTSTLGLGIVETIDAPLTLEGSYAFANNSTSPTLLVFGGAITDAASGTQTLAVSGVNNTTIVGAIGGGTGTLALTKSGTGTLNLDGNDTFTGGVTINGGFIQIFNTGAFNAATPNTVTFGSGSIGGIILSGNSLTIGGLNTNATVGTPEITNQSGMPATLTVNNSNPSIYNGILQDGGVGSLALVKSGSGTLQLGGNNAFTGGVTINSGILQIGAAGALNTATPNPVAFGPASTGTLQLGGNSLTIGGLSSNATLGSPIVENNTSGNNPATLTIAQPNTTTFAGVIQDGSVGAALTVAYSGPLGATLSLSGNNTFSGGLVVNGGGLLLNGSNTFTGGVTLNGGFIQLDNAGGLNAAGVNAVAFGAGSSGALVLDGNSITISGLDSNATVGSPVVENAGLTAATLTVNNTGHSIYAGVLVNGGPGALALTKTGTGSLTLSGANTFTGVVTVGAGTLTLGGGSLTANVLNQATFQYNGGTFSGRLTNAGTATFNAPFTAGNGLENDSSLSVAAGQSITLNGAGLDNEGTLAMTGGTLNLSTSAANVNRGNFNLSATVSLSSGPFSIQLNNQGSLTLNGGLINGSSGMLTNGAGGTISGTGTISSGFNNLAGAVIVGPGTLNLTQGFTNGGGIQLTALNANLTGGAITNTGTIQGFGNLGNAVTNFGIVEASGGTLFITGSTGGLFNSGTLTADAGAKLLITQGLAMNSGIINLTGGTFDNNGHPLNNLATGQISGWGIFRTGGTGLDNNASITFSGGTTTVNGPVTNENGRTITIAQNPAIFTGLVTNNVGGIFNTTNTTATFAGGFTNNGSSNFIKAGDGTVEVDVAPTLNDSSSLSISSGTMRFNVVSGSPTIGKGVTATVSNAATLELAGSVSALSAGANRVDIVNNSSAADGLLVSGTNQQVGKIDGTGATVVDAGSDLTADHIVQAALVIGGAAKNPALVTIDASDAAGNPLTETSAAESDSILGGSLQPNIPFAATATTSSNLLPASATLIDDDPIPAGLVADGPDLGGSPSAVPEPATWLMLAFGLLAGAAHRICRRRVAEFASAV